jgi:hypothetical protein
MALHHELHVDLTDTMKRDIEYMIGNVIECVEKQVSEHEERLENSLLRDKDTRSKLSGLSNALVCDRLAPLPPSL